MSRCLAFPRAKKKENAVFRMERQQVRFEGINQHDWHFLQLLMFQTIVEMPMIGFDGSETMTCSDFPHEISGRQVVRVKDTTRYLSSTSSPISISK